MIASFGDLIKVPVQIEESEWSCVFVLEVSSLPLSTILVMELFRQCGILELFRQCGILELFRQCGIL